MPKGKSPKEPDSSAQSGTPTRSATAANTSNSPANPSGAATRSRSRDGRSSAGAEDLTCPSSSGSNAAIDINAILKNLLSLDSEQQPEGVMSGEVRSFLCNIRYPGMVIPTHNDVRAYVEDSFEGVRAVVHGGTYQFKNLKLRAGWDLACHESSLYLTANGNESSAILPHLCYEDDLPLPHHRAILSAKVGLHPSGRVHTVVQFADTTCFSLHTALSYVFDQYIERDTAPRSCVKLCGVGAFKKTGTVAVLAAVKGKGGEEIFAFDQVLNKTHSPSAYVPCRQLKEYTYGKETKSGPIALLALQTEPSFLPYPETARKEHREGLPLRLLRPDCMVEYEGAGMLAALATYAFAECRASVVSVVTMDFREKERDELIPHPEAFTILRDFMAGLLDEGLL